MKVVKIKTENLVEMMSPSIIQHISEDQQALQTMTWNKNDTSAVF